MILGCGPTANLKSTNAHGIRQRMKEMVQRKASGYFTWTDLLCWCILRFALDLVTDTTWTTKRLFNWTKLK